MPNDVPRISPRPRLSIPALTRISDYRDQIIFLENRFNRTQIRNTCYLLQLRELVLQINNNYNIYKGGWHIFLYNFLRINADCCEGLMYCFKARHMQNTPTGECNFNGLLNYVKAINNPRPVIDRDCRKTLEKLVSFRNNLHPDRQSELHIKVLASITDEDRVALVNLPRTLTRQFKEYLEVAI